MLNRTVDAKGLKTNDFKETTRGFSTVIIKKISPEKIWVKKGSQFSEKCCKLFKTEEIPLYSIKIETKAAFVERTVRSPIIILYRYWGDNGWNYIHKLTHFVTTINSRRNCSMELISKKVKRCTVYKRSFWNFGNFLRKTLNIRDKRWTRRDYPWWIFSKRLHQNHLTLEALTIELVSNATAQRFPDKTLISFTNCSPQQLNLEYQWEVTISETCYLSIYQNIREKDLVILDRKFSKTSEYYSLESGLYPSIT